MQPIKTLLFILLSLFSTLSFAEKSIDKINGFYFGLGSVFGGSYTLDGSKNQTPSGTKIILGESILDGLTGEIQFLDMNYNNDNLSTGELQLQSIAYSLLFYFDTGERYYPFIKLGYHGWSSVVLLNGKNTADNGSNGFYGIGLKIKIFNEWFAKIDYEVMKFEPSDEKINFNTVSLSIINYF